MRRALNVVRRELGCSLPQVSIGLVYSIAAETGPLRVMVFSVERVEEMQSAQEKSCSALIQAAPVETRRVAHTVRGVVELHHTQDAELGCPDIVEAG
jgi:hypothetical protein